MDIEKLNSKVTELEKRINEMGKVKSVKERKPREKSEYNIFVQKFIETEKKKDNSKTHKELFSEAAKAWSAKKSEKK